MHRQFTTPGELEQVRAAGRLASRVLSETLLHVKPGFTTAHIAHVAEHLITAADAAPVLKGYRFSGEQPFPAAACVSVNNEALYAVPSPRALVDGDVVNVDIALRTKLGWHADVAASVCVGKSDRAERLVAASHAAVDAIAQSLAPGVWWSHAATAAHAAVGEFALFLVPGVAGHGVGRTLHEAPALYIGSPAQPDVRLAPGMILAIEPLVTENPTSLIECPTGWTARTADGCWAAFQERMVAITPAGAELLTGC